MEHPIPPALARAMRRYVVASHIGLLAAGLDPRTASAAEALAIMLAHRAASVEFFGAAGELGDFEAQVLRRFVVLVDRNLGLA